MTPLKWLLIAPLILVAFSMYLTVLLAAAFAVAGLCRRLRVKAEVQRGLRDLRGEPSPNPYEYPGWPK